MSQILVLRDRGAFYADTIATVLKGKFQGYAYVMEWENVPPGKRPEEFWKTFWKRAGQRYEFVVVLGPKSLKFALENVKDRPVFYLQNYQRPYRTPPNFASLYVAVSYPKQLSGIVCTFKEAKLLGILTHREEWDLLSNVFTGEYPGVMEVHIRVVGTPSQMEEAIADLKDVGVKVVWVPSASRLNTGNYIRNLLKASHRMKVGVFVDQISMVRQKGGALGAWEPTPGEVGEALANFLAEIREASAPYVKVREDTVGNSVVKRKEVNWRAFLKPHYVREVKGGRAAINLNLVRAFRLNTVAQCVERFDEKY